MARAGPARPASAGPARAGAAESPWTYTLLGADGCPYRSTAPGQFGGHRRARIYGRLDCRSARRAIARGGYTAHRVFFADEQTAVAAGYRPCAVCLPAAYAAWKAHGTSGAD